MRDCIAAKAQRVTSGQIEIFDFTFVKSIRAVLCTDWPKNDVKTTAAVFSAYWHAPCV